MRVLSVASECAPLVKTGGLADVAGALPGALAGHGVEMRVMLPGYRGLAARLEGAERLSIRVGRRTERLIAGRCGALAVLLHDAPALFAREGRPYTGPDGADWPDNHLRFGRFAETAAAVARQGLGGWQPDLVHAHDWQAGLVPLYLRLAGGGPPVLMTIHNIAFQGLYGPEMLADLGLPASVMTQDLAEFWGSLGFLKAGLATANRLSTVSPSYAEELKTPEFGMGLDGLLRHRGHVLSGILNGIDTGLWDPATDPAIAAPYSAEAPEGKAKNRAALAARFALSPAEEAPLFVVISRLTHQKGLDLLLSALPVLRDRGASLALLGQGDAALEEGFATAAAENPDRIAAEIGFDEPLSRLMQAGGDAILVPSRFEPCGLTQLCGLRYGTLPVVSRTGGLSDTVIDANAAALAAGVATGLQHAPDDAGALARAIARTCDLFGTEHWARMRANALTQPVGWERAAGDYAALYREMTAR